jgi:hypothetical protein
MKNISTQANLFGKSSAVARGFIFAFLLMISTAFYSVAYAQDKDFQQAANGSSPDYFIKFNNGMVNRTNSTYGEGMAVPQRLIFTGLTGSTHSIKFRHQAAKGDQHGFDFLTSWQQSVQAAAFLYNGYANELNLLFDANYRCSETIGNSSSNACTVLSDVLPANQVATLTLGTLPNIPSMPAHSIANAINYFEHNAGWSGTGYGARTIEIRTNDEIVSANITFDGYDAGPGDYYATYTLSWTSSATDVMIRFAAHIAVGEDSGGYGFGFGASSVSGGPYHIRLAELDGHPTGSIDNQIQVPDMPTGNIILPVNLLSFTARHTESGNILSWITGQEYMNRGFEVQRSADGFSFSKLSFINSMAPDGNSQAKLYYTYKDANLKSGKYFYRLSQQDFDGNKKYSSIVILSNDMAPALSINRIYGRNEQTFISVDCPLSGVYKILVADISGRVTSHQSAQLDNGTNEIVLETRKLNNGVYVIKVISVNSSESVSSRFVKTW